MYWFANLRKTQQSSFANVISYLLLGRGAGIVALGGARLNVTRRTGKNFLLCYFASTKISFRKGQSTPKIGFLKQYERNNEQSRIFFKASRKTRQIETKTVHSREPHVFRGIFLAPRSLSVLRNF